MYKLSKEQFDQLPEFMKENYKTEGDSYVPKEVLAPPGYESPDAIAELKRAKDRETQEAKSAREKAASLQSKLDEISADDKRKIGDIDGLDKSWNDKFEAQKAEYESKLSGKDKFITEQLVDNVASVIANDISVSPNVILPHIKSRLAADMDGDSPKTVVLDPSGQRSAATLEELKKEFMTNDDFSNIIKGTNASGSGASGSKDGNSGAVSLAELRKDGRKEQEFAEKHPDKYKQMLVDAGDLNG